MDQSLEQQVKQLKQELGRAMEESLVDQSLEQQVKQLKQELGRAMEARATLWRVLKDISVVGGTMAQEITRLNTELDSLKTKLGMEDERRGLEEDEKRRLTETTEDLLRSVEYADFEESLRRATVESERRVVEDAALYDEP